MFDDPAVISSAGCFGRDGGLASIALGLSGEHQLGYVVKAGETLGISNQRIFRYFKTLTKIIRLAVMMNVR